MVPSGLTIHRPVRPPMMHPRKDPWLERPSGRHPTPGWMSKGTRNRVKIIAAAWELYADLGIDKVRTEDVARGRR
jgi:AcrR family transcriptional regulator